MRYLMGRSHNRPVGWRWCRTPGEPLSPQAAVTVGETADRGAGRLRQRRYRGSGHLREVRLAAAGASARHVIYADSSADSAGPELLYQAIGATNPRAYSDTEAVGHAATGN